MLALAFLLLAALAPSKTYDAVYVATLSDIPPGLQSLDVWIPLPKSSEHQKVSDVRIESPYKWTRRTEPVWGNVYAYARIPKPQPGVLTTKVAFTVTRSEAQFAMLHAGHGKPPATTLRPNRLVTLSPRMHELADTVTAGKSGTLSQARAIYDHLLATMTYDKTTPGWGMGDSERACDVRKGNCTDFHSLFMSLARAKGIPSRFVIGFPLTANDGVAKGYHCWAEFWLDGKGWVPVDASDASKSSDPKVRDYLFGNLDTARVQFTTGRDLELQPATSEPLNYFVYPRGEAGGNVTGVPSIALEFHPR
ncbi:MAG TPA: transglutaminase-like domain-containing protein [Thermoanaerobaculia bacterium]|jgi:transglutaminase-like putative cysteine protease